MLSFPFPAIPPGQPGSSSRAQIELAAIAHSSPPSPDPIDQAICHASHRARDRRRTADRFAGGGGGGCEPTVGLWGPPRGNLICRPVVEGVEVAGQYLMLSSFLRSLSAKVV